MSEKREGALFYDKESGRYDIRFGLDSYYGWHYNPYSSGTGHGSPGLGRDVHSASLAVHWFLPPFPMTGHPESPPRHSFVPFHSISAAYMHSFPPHPQIHGNPSLYSGSHGRNVGLQYNISIYLTCLSCNPSNLF